MWNPQEKSGSDWAFDYKSIIARLYAFSIRDTLSSGLIPAWHLNVHRHTLIRKCFMPQYVANRQSTASCDLVHPFLSRAVHRNHRLPVRSP